MRKHAIDDSRGPIELGYALYGKFLTLAMGTSCSVLVMYRFEFNVSSQRVVPLAVASDVFDTRPSIYISRECVSFDGGSSCERAAKTIGAAN